MPGWLMAVQIAFTLVFFLVMYKFIPLVIATQLQQRVPALSGWIAFNLVNRAVRLVIFVGFLWVLALSKEIHRVFEYHGAEHRVVFNFESGKPPDRGQRPDLPHVSPALRHESPAPWVMLVSIVV